MDTDFCLTRIILFFKRVFFRRLEIRCARFILKQSRDPLPARETAPSNGIFLTDFEHFEHRNRQ